MSYLEYYLLRLAVRIVLVGLGMYAGKVIVRRYLVSIDWSLLIHGSFTASLIVGFAIPGFWNYRLRGGSQPSQGRCFLAPLVGQMTLLTVGLLALLPRRLQGPGHLVVQVGMMLLTLVVYSATTGLIAQLVIFPNPISARAVDSAHNGPIHNGEVAIHDFLLALASGQATVERAENVDVRWFGLGDEARPVLWMHPPASAAYSVTVPARGALEIAPAIHPQVWLPEYGDGVLFTVQVNDGKRDETVFYQAIDAKNVPEDRRWHDTRIDLEPYAGQQVTIAFTTDPTGDRIAGTGQDGAHRSSSRPLRPTEHSSRTTVHLSLTSADYLIEFPAYTGLAFSRC